MPKFIQFSIFSFLLLLLNYREAREELSYPISNPKPSMIDLSNFKQLIGNWSGQMNDKIIIENWEAIDSKRLIGSGSFVIGTDTNLYEILCVDRI